MTNEFIKASDLEKEFQENREKRIEDMKVVQTTTTIPKKDLRHIKKNGYKISQLILLGLKAKEDNPQLIERIRRVETMVTSLMRIEGKIDKILEKKDL